jgi:hypothetical protein
MSPDVRRAIRNGLLCIVVLALLGIVYWATYLLSHDILGIREIARLSLIITGLFVLGCIAENVGRVVVKGPGNTEADIGGGNAP